MNNKMILAAGISLLSMNVLNGEITGEHTMWSGTHLNYDGVSIINKPALPQKGVEAKKGVKNAYNIMPGKVTVITSLNKNPQEKQEWLYKKIHEVRISMTSPIRRMMSPSPMIPINLEHREPFIHKSISRPCTR